MRNYLLKGICFHFFICVFLFSATAQELSSTTIDSLEQLLTTTSEDTTRYSVLYDLHNHYQAIDTDLALKYFYQKIALSKQMQDRFRLARSLNHISRYWLEKFEIDSMNTYALQALDVLGDCQKEECFNLKSYPFSYLIYGATVTYNKEQAKQYAYMQLEVANKRNKPIVQANALSKVAYILLEEGQIDSALAINNQALKLIEGCSGKKCFDALSSAYKTLATALDAQHKTEDAQKMLLKFIAIADTLQGIDPDSKESTVSVTYNTLGIYANETSDFDNALIYLKKAHDYAVKTEYLDLQRWSSHNIAIAYRNIGESDKALVHIRNAMAIADTLSDESGRLVSMTVLTDTYEDLGYTDSLLILYDSLLVRSRVLGLDNIRYHSLAGLLGLQKNIPEEQLKQYVTELKGLLNDATYTERFATEAIYRGIYDYHFQRNEFQLAKAYANLYAATIQEQSIDTTKRGIYSLKIMADVEMALGQYESAATTYQKLLSITNIVNQRNQQEALAATAIEMDLAENELARQKAEQATRLEQQASAARSRFFTFLLIIAGLILAGVIWAYRRVQHDKQLISEKSQLLEQSLDEKEVLLREIHHRVKNNLQIISSLLDKQARKSSDEAVRKLVKEGQERIQSMALIHQNLYESDQLSGIDIKSYLQELSHNIQKSQAINTDQVQLQLNIEDEKLDIDTAIPVGLILNELLTNSYKYAFPQNEQGEIRVDFKKEGSQYHLQVSDNGIGFSPTQANKKSKSLGLNLVKGLVRQLEGSLEWLNVEHGAVVDIRF